MNLRHSHQVVSRDAWLAARQELLAAEKAWIRQRDELTARRRALPWVRIDKPYRFEGPHGPESLADLFATRSQLIVHHFMFGPDWEEGCPGCSFNADNTEGGLVHLAQHDVSFVRISRAPLERIAAYNRRMGWSAKWVSSHDSDFNFDFHVSFRPEELSAGTAVYNYAPYRLQDEERAGFSVFFRDPDSGEIYHTYSCYARGDEAVLGTYFYLDLTPKGRGEDGFGDMRDWLRRHDRYDRPLP